MWQTYEPVLIDLWNRDPEAAVDSIFDRPNTIFSINCTDIYCSLGWDASIFDRILDIVLRKEQELGIHATEAEKIVNLNEYSFEFFCPPTKSTVVELARKIAATYSDEAERAIKLGVLAGSLVRVEK